MEKNWKKYHQALIIVSGESDEGFTKKLDDFKQQGEIYHHDIPYKILAFKKDNVKQFNNQQVIQIPSDLNNFKHILPNKMKLLSFFTGRHTRSTIATIKSTIHENSDNDGDLTLKQIEGSCGKFRTITSRDLDEVLDCGNGELFSITSQGNAPQDMDNDRGDIYKSNCIDV